MGRTATSSRRRTASRKPRKMQKRKVDLHLDDFEGAKAHDPLAYLTSIDNIGKAIVECLENNDPEGVMEVIATYLEAVNKTKLSKDHALHRQTLYSVLRHKNPTIKTLAKLMHSYVV